MGKNFKLIQVNFLIILSLISVTISGQVMNNQDLILDDNIKTVQFYRDDSSPQTVINPPITGLDQRNKIVLEFDELGDQAKYYYARIVHCNKDWTKSSLASPEFMTEYNEFLIEDYSFSFNTKIHFTHYRFEVPRLNVSGNYLLLIYPSDNPENIAIQKRFIIFENLVKIIPHFRVSELVGKRETHQQVGFEVYYDQFDIVMPQKEIQACIRQNQRWDNARYMLEPLYFDDANKELDYRYFDDKTNFPAWNEFRNFAFRNVNFRDANVQILDIDSQSVEVQKLMSRAVRSYVNYFDVNGNFIIENNIGDPQLASDYFETTISFHSPELEGDYFLMGKLTNWSKNENNKFIYDQERKLYEVKSYFKQGFYDYLVEYSPSGGEEEEIVPWTMEGSFFQTQNEYEIIIYHTAIGSRYDRVIGYLNRPFFLR